MNVVFSNVNRKKNLLPLLLLVAGLLMSFHRPIFSLLSPAKLDLQIQHQPVIMPAVYKVYANENALSGKYSLFKMLITNNSNNTAQNVEVSFQIPNFIEWKSIAKFPVILSGQSVVVNCYPSFPDRIVDKTTSSKETVNIKVTGGNISEIDQDFGIDMKGRNDFLYSCLPADEIRTGADAFDNMGLLTCYVTPEDPIIKYYTQKIQEKILKGEAAFEGKDEKEGVRFLTGIYYATALSHMVYSGTSGVPAKIDDVSSLFQSIRLPREVITGKTGLCIELSLVYASIMMNAGMDPVIYLIPGHAYPGFKMNGHYYALEATGINGEGIGGVMSVDQAYQRGMKEANEFFQMYASGDSRYMILDVRDAISKGAVAMELKDDSYLRQKIDEIAQSFEADHQIANQPQNNAQQQNNDQQNNEQRNNDENQNNNENNNENNNDNNGGSTPNGYNLYKGTVTFAYPGSWRIHPRMAQSMPQLKHIVANANNTAYVEVYQFAGYNDAAQAVEAVQQYVSGLGGRLQYKTKAQNKTGYTLYSGQTFFNQGGINWIAAFKSSGNGVVGIAAGANLNTGAKYKTDVLNIINSLR